MPSAFRYYFNKAKSAAILLLALGGAVLVVYLLIGVAWPAATSSWKLNPYAGFDGVSFDAADMVLLTERRALDLGPSSLSLDPGWLAKTYDPEASRPDFRLVLAATLDFNGKGDIVHLLVSREDYRGDIWNVAMNHLSESYGKKPDEIETLLSDGLDFMWVRDSSPESSRIVGFAQCDDSFYCVYLVSWFSDREYRDASLAATFAKLASNWVPDL